MRQWRKLSGGLIALSLTLVLTACGAAEESAPVVVGSIEEQPAPVPLESATQAVPATTPAGSGSGADPIVPPTGAPVPTADPYADQALIDRTEWTDTVDGPRLLIYPTEAGRLDTFPTAGERAWQQVLTADPDSDTPGMRDQFICHWDWARVVASNKTSWNIEPWRPAVGYQQTVDALCNPGGPER
ncbi:DUF2599 domain-containing protein [Nocardia crassostreae]|uniref:DUF2599 domain-containing protein n=1 Tax=Nocardia crassostreae TaxID=53428 RepID=UPI00083123FC|nr:DUF2599 domain-containing protein [Nocardia crassostreae]